MTELPAEYDDGPDDDTNDGDPIEETDYGPIEEPPAVPAPDDTDPDQNPGYQDGDPQ